MRQRLDLEQHGRKQAQTQICTLLNEFVQSCLDLPGVDDNPSLKRSFEELRSKSERLLEFGIEMVAAVQVAADGASRTDFLRTTVTEAEDNVTGKIKFVRDVRRLLYLVIVTRYVIA